MERMRGSPRIRSLISPYCRGRPGRPADTGPLTQRRDAGGGVPYKHSKENAYDYP